MNALRWIVLLLFAATGHAQSYPSDSIYQLQASLVDQTGRERGLDAAHGHPVLVTMFYGSCPMACPLLIDTLRATESKLTPQQRAQLRVLMISIDPDRDTPAALAQLATARRIDTSRWTLARTEAASVRKLAAMLGIQYRRLPSGAFNHASVIVLLDRSGAIKARTSTIGRADEQMLHAITVSTGADERRKR